MAVPITVPGAPTSPLTYKVPGSTAFVPRSASANFDGSGAAGSFLPTMRWVAQSGEVIGRYTAPEVAAGSSAEVSWFPNGLKRVSGGGLTLDYNLGEVGGSIETTSQQTSNTQIQYQDINVGEGILILAAAPSVRSLGATPAHPVDVFDNVGNTYTQLGSFAFEANPPNVNEGMYVTLFWCPSNIAPQVAGVNAIEVDWDDFVFDRIVEIWSVRHSGGQNTPTVLAHTADHDAAAYAAGQVTLTAPNFTPARDKALEFAIIVTAKTGGVGSFGAAVGYNGFFQAEARLWAGSKQSYITNPQTHGANAYLIAGAVPAPYEDDVGVLPGGVLVPAFNGVGQAYSAGTNAWKGIILLGLD